MKGYQHSCKTCGDSLSKFFVDWFPVTGQPRSESTDCSHVRKPQYNNFITFANDKIEPEHMHNDVQTRAGL